jgi:flagellar motor switch/type III secretory pathway protein FliN
LRDARASREVLEEAKKWLLEGLSEWGLGAKTSSGYGVFEVARAGEGDRRAEPGKASAAAAAPAQRRKFVATIDSWLEKEDSLLLRPEGEAEVIPVPLQRALQRAGLSVHKLRQLREQKIRLDVELDANGEVRTLLKRK